MQIQSAVLSKKLPFMRREKEKRKKLFQRPMSSYGIFDDLDCIVNRCLM